MKVALRTQQIIAHETRVPSVVDPLGGSFYVEALTNRITTSYPVPMDWRAGFDGAARDFVDGLLEGRQPAQDVHTARKVLQVPLALYEANRLQRPVAPEAMT